MDSKIFTSAFSTMTKPKSIQDGNLSLGQKAQIVKYATQQTKVNHVTIAKWASETFKTHHPIHRSTISRILQRQHEYEHLTPHEQKITLRRPVLFPEMETALKNWALKCQQKKIRLTTALIKEKVQRLAEALDCGGNLKFSNGWYESFANRHGFRGFATHGESGDAQMEGTEERVVAIKAKIASYSLDDVYNMDETAYLYNLIPDKTIAQHRIEGGKKDKTRITLALTYNATGTDRVELLILGHAKKPHCFKKKSGEEHGFFYLHNTKAWMTGVFFHQYLHRFNAHVRRKVLLLIDNAPSHIWKDSDFPNLEIVALPSNITSKLQPLDQGIIAGLKCGIRKQQLSYALDALDHDDNPKPYKINQLMAMQWARNAWRSMKPTVIQNCWRHTGLLDVGVPETTEPINRGLVIDDATRTDYESFIARADIRYAMSIDNFLNPVEEEEILLEIEMIEEEELILESAKTVEVDEEQEAIEAEGIALYSDMSKEEELTVLAKAIAVYERREHPLHETSKIVGALRGVQRNIRWEIEREKAEKATQKSIRQYFG